MLHGIWLERRLCPLNSLDSKAAVGIVWLAKLANQLPNSKDFNSSGFNSFECWGWVWNIKLVESILPEGTHHKQQMKIHD